MEAMDKVSRSLVSRAERYKALHAESLRLDDELGQLALDLLALIPAGREAEGLQHQVSTRYKLDEKELRRLGHWNMIVKESVDTDKLKSLVKLMPVLVNSGAVEVLASDRLVVKREV